MCHRARLSVCVCVCVCVCLCVPKTESATDCPTVGPLPFMRDDRRATGRWLRETGERRRRVRSAVPGPCVGWGLPVAVHAMNEHLEMGDHERRHGRRLHAPCDEAEAWRPTTITREGQQPW